MATAENLSEVQKIQIVLDGALVLAQDNGYRFINLPGADESLSKAEFHKLLEARIYEKRELLSGVPTASQTYKFMLEDAKATLESLKIGNYNIPVIRFINGFLKLESLFVNNVAYIGEKQLEEFKVNEDGDMGPVEKQREYEPVNQTILELEEGITGEQLMKVKKMEKEMAMDGLDLESLSLEEEDEDMSPEQISKLGLDESEDGESQFIEEDFTELHEEE